MGVRWPKFPGGPHEPPSGGLKGGSTDAQPNMDHKYIVVEGVRGV